MQHPEFLYQYARDRLSSLHREAETQRFIRSSPLRHHLAAALVTLARRLEPDDGAKRSFAQDLSR